MTRTIALITGASSGIGAAYARLLAADRDLVLVARRADRLDDLAEELRTRGAAVEVLPADLTTHDGIATVTDRLAAGDVRMLISNAGTGGYAPLIDVDLADIDRLLTLNAVAPIQLVRAALPGMLAAGEGSIVTVASLLAFSAGLTDPRAPRRTLYVAGKAATLAFTRTLADELADTPVRTQVVCPGVVATEWNSGAGRTIPWAMSAEDVATASLAGLRLGETVCAPGLEEQADALDALLAAETALASGGNQPTLATRYTGP
ncbi:MULTISPECIES: SDR family NAD(P)-dependent oxidoreductase [unclassified Frankia]|uniref:SDR family NAD(P)-dependent oxidoreductase n=1 Tax=unclassified Frankia TaxID=2632575 RepID=UPI002AD582FE|nr:MULTISPECIES: SDR family NAD(P)-dependent oxidoreductase [unclassified Frankia]